MIAEYTQTIENEFVICVCSVNMYALSLSLKYTHWRCDTLRIARCFYTYCTCIDNLPHPAPTPRRQCEAATTRVQDHGCGRAGTNVEPLATARGVRSGRAHGESSRHTLVRLQVAQDPTRTDTPQDQRLSATNMAYSSGRVIRTHGAEAQPQVLRWFFVGWAASLRFLSGGFLPKVKIHD